MRFAGPEVLQVELVELKPTYKVYKCRCQDCKAELHQPRNTGALNGLFQSVAKLIGLNGWFGIIKVKRKAHLGLCTQD